MRLRVKCARSQRYRRDKSLKRVLVIFGAATRIHDPPCRAVHCDENDILRLRQTGSTMVGHAVVNPCRPGECIGQSLSDACGEV